MSQGNQPNTLVSNSTALQKPSEKKPSSFGSFLKTLIYAVLIALVIRTFAYEPFNIPTKSMVPTLLDGDYVFVSKFAYGYSGFSVPFFSLPVEGRLFGSIPERGDVVVFRLPKDGKTDYIKRLVGFPGDEIQVKQGLLYINGQPVKREKIEDYIETYRPGVTAAFTQYIETFPNGNQHRIIELSDNHTSVPDPLVPLPYNTADNTPVYKVPAGHYFMMGDNRDNSADSRVLSQVGFVPERNLIGKAQLRFFSLKDAASIWQIWLWPSKVRTERLFTVIR
jgi:signal peptidase I